MNPFSQAAADLIEKRQRWDKLTEARGWVLEHYTVSKTQLGAKHTEASALRGYDHAMSCLIESIRLLSKEELLDWIDLELALLGS